MSAWNHLLCEGCWETREPDRVPVRLKVAPDAALVPCCACARLTLPAIYVRADPATLPCKGLTGEHADES